jgi:hypothetical protein
MNPVPIDTSQGLPPGLARRDFLKVGVGFSLALTFAGAVGGCSDAGKAPVKGFAFLKAGDVELFSALAPAVVVDLAALDAAQRSARIGDVLRNLDASFVAMGLASQQEVRKLLDLLGIAPLRYVLTGVGAWKEAGVEKLQAFLERWRGSRFATLNAGGNVLVKLIAASYYVLPVSWPASGYPGPLERVYKAVNS